MVQTAMLTQTLLEATTGFLTFVLVDAAGAGIDGAQVDVMELTYVDVATGQVLNGREAQDVLNTNNVLLLVDPGPPVVTLVQWALQPGDTVRLDARREVEPHLAVFAWTWDQGAQQAAYKVQFGIEARRYILQDL